MLQSQRVAAHTRSNEFDQVTGFDPVAHIDQQRPVISNLINNTDEIVTADVGRIVLLADGAWLAEDKAGRVAAVAQFGQFAQPFGAAVPVVRVVEKIVQSLTVDPQHRCHIVNPFPAPFDLKRVHAACDQRRNLLQQAEVA